MSRSRKGLRAEQLTIDDFVSETEHIHGAVPSSAELADAAKAVYYQELFDRQSKIAAIVCSPALGIHLFRPMSRHCQCHEERRPLIEAIGQQEEHK